MSKQAASLPADVGLCHCNVRNSKRATRCHACGETLPWVKPAPAPKIKPQGPPKIAGGLNANVNVGIDSEAIGLWGFGLVVFLVSIFFPLGFTAYRILSRYESPLANFAGAGALLGVGLFIWVQMDSAVNKPKTDSGYNPRDSKYTIIKNID